MSGEPEYKIAIIGSGPAGLSAAGRAAFLDRDSGTASPSYVLLEGFDCPSKTIFRYQKGKHVMAEPGYLQLRSDMDFDQGTRESILDVWNQNLSAQAVNIRFNSKVSSVQGEKGYFRVATDGGDTLTAENIVLAIGTEGNPRMLGVAGDSLPRVQYQLDDPDEYSGETIVVFGAGDSAVENALALARQNRVIIVNRKDEFARIKDGNRELLLAALSDKNVAFDCYYKTTAAGVEELDDGRINVRLNAPEGEVEIVADRVIARLGSIPPRGFLESCGIELPSKSPVALPELTDEYESNKAGIYVIGSLAGYPLIKQAMNQGYDVVEFINGNRVQTIEQQLLEYQFKGFPFEREADDMARLLMTRVPMFGLLNVLAFRELIIESDIRVSYADPESGREAAAVLEELRQKIAAGSAPGKPLPKSTQIMDEGAVIYKANDYGVSFFTILDGEVILESETMPGGHKRLGSGLFFGETSLIAGQPRQETAIAGANCIIMETPRRTILKLMSSNEAVKAGIDWVFIVRELQRVFAPRATVEELRPFIDQISQHTFTPGSVLWSAGDTGDSVHIVRNGTVALYKSADKDKTLVAEVRAGGLIGKTELFGEPQRKELAVASVLTETLEVPRALFRKLASRDPEQLEVIRKQVSRNLLETADWEVRPESGFLLNFLLDEGLGEATNALIIDEYLCVGCDNCETACAETHDGISRLKRREGATKAHLHVPVSCRHCQQPHCMKDCPPNAIHRASSGEVYIDDSCIGCGNCATNCPYDVIAMEYPAEEKPGLLNWLLFGTGPGPGNAVRAGGADAVKKAYKCDACVGQDGGPACVSACPTGAAKRVSPEMFVQAIERNS